jgi:organic hydroperoxide reductase OsmC/OhrA
MANFPHIYTTSAQGSNDVILSLTAEKLPELAVTPPIEFGGPEGHWNPEALFSASISTCFILTFKAIAKSKKLTWSKVNVDADAYLDKNGHQLSFNRVEIFVTLTIPLSEAGKEEHYLDALKKAEETCLITNSISASIQLYPKIEFKA